MIVTGIPVKIPDGQTCKHQNGEVCRLFHWGAEDGPFCRGWRGFHKVNDFQKHEFCKSLDTLEGPI